MFNITSLSFNGSTRYAKLSTAASIRDLSSFAFLAWIKVGDNALNTNQHAYVERQGTGNGIRFRCTPVKGKLQFGFSPKDGVTDTSYTYNTTWDNHWHLVGFAARLGGERPTYEITFDSVVVASGTLVVPPEELDDQGNPVQLSISDTEPLGIYVGNHSRSAANPASATAWHGLIDDILIFDNAVSQGEINSYFSSDDFWDPKDTIPADIDQNLLYSWNFNENSGSITRDLKDNTRTGTLYQSGTPSSALWTIDRPYLGEGLKDTTIPSTPTLAVPTGVNADEAFLSWSESTDNVWVQFYELQVSEFANFSSTSSYDTGRLTSHKVTNLLPQTNYYARVRAFDAQLNASLYSTVRSWTTSSVGDITPPNPPTNLAASYVTHSSFRVTFTPSSSVDAVGYKLDMSEYSDFRSFVGDYRNQDIGNDIEQELSQVKPLTSYYVRVRAYDAYDNESNDSVVLRVNTPRQPDMTPPLPATMLDATGVTSRAAILNWMEGVDDVGVAGYYVDISTSPLFSDRVTTNDIYWDTVDVGNMTHYRVEGLEPETMYFYRVRAYDEAGNIAPNVTEGMSFVTSPPSMYEGGYIESVLYPNRFAVVDSRYPATPTSDEIGTMIEELEVSVDHSAYMSYTLEALVGVLERGTLSLFPTTTGTLRIRASQGELDEGITYETRPEITGGIVEVEVISPNEWIEVDISSLITTMSAYVIELTSPDETSVLVYIGNGESLQYRPYINVQNDPLASTQPLDTTVKLIENARMNISRNPSVETSLQGWEGIGNSIERVSGGTDGSWCIRASGSGAWQGVYNHDVGNFSPVEVGEQYTFSCDLRRIAGGTTYYLYIQGVTNTGFVNNTLLDWNVVNVRNAWDRYGVTAIIPEGVTHARLVVYHTEAQSFVFEMDNVLYEKTDLLGVPFNGNTPNAIWMNEANESESRLFAPRLHVTTPFLGDSNHNNDARLFFRRADDTTQEWIPGSHTPVVNRDLNQYHCDLGPTIRNYNLVINSSFEDQNLNEWEGYTGGDIVGTDAYLGSHCYSAYYFVRTLKNIPVTSGATYTLQGRVKGDPETITYSRIHYYDAQGTELSTDLSDDYVFGDGATWNLHAQTFTVPQDATSVTLTFLAENTQQHFYLDCVQINAGNRPLPYRDGDTFDGVWEGTAHHSVTGIQLTHESQYLLMTEFTDPEGFFDTTDSTVYQHVVTHEIGTPPDDVLTVAAIELSAEDTTIHVSIPYAGDDNENARVRLEFKRSDLNMWSEFRPTYLRRTKRITGTIPNLKSGTNYTIRAYFEDPDGVYGASGNVLTNTVTTNYAGSTVSAEPHISFGGFVLMGRDDKKVAATYHDAFGFPERRVAIDDLPRLEGAVERQALWGKKIITVRGFISGDSREDLEEVKDALKRALAPKQQRLIIDTLSRKGRFYYATCESLDIEEAGEDNISHLEWNASFACANPFAYSLAETTLPAFTAPNDGTVSVINEGDASLDPYIVLTTTSRYPVATTLMNVSTGERMAPKTTIVNGDKLIIDCERKSLTKNGVEIDYSGSFPILSAGGNEFKFQLAITRTATTSGTIAATIPEPTVQAEMRWRHKFL